MISSNSASTASSDTSGKKKTAGRGSSPITKSKKQQNRLASLSIPKLALKQVKGDDELSPCFCKKKDGLGKRFVTIKDGHISI